MWLVGHRGLRGHTEEKASGKPPNEKSTKNNKSQIGCPDESLAKGPDKGESRQEQV